MTTLVTGGAGFIGSHLCERLLAETHEVVSLDCYDDFYDPATKRENLAQCRDHSRFQEVEGDIRDHSVLDALPEVEIRPPGGAGGCSALDPKPRSLQRGQRGGDAIAPAIRSGA